MDIKIHDTFFENMCCKKSAKEYEKFILRCGISVKSENAIQIMPDRTADPVRQYSDVEGIWL